MELAAQLEIGAHSLTAVMGLWVGLTGRHVPRIRHTSRVLAVTRCVLVLVAGATPTRRSGATPTGRSIARILPLAGGTAGFVVLGQVMQLDVSIGAAL